MTRLQSFPWGDICNNFACASNYVTPNSGVRWTCDTHNAHNSAMSIYHHKNHTGQTVLFTSRSSVGEHSTCYKKVSTRILSTKCHFPIKMCTDWCHTFLSLVKLTLFYDIYCILQIARAESRQISFLIYSGYVEATWLCNTWIKREFCELSEYVLVKKFRLPQKSIGLCKWDWVDFACAQPNCIF